MIALTVLILFVYSILDSIKLNARTKTMCIVFDSGSSLWVSNGISKPLSRFEKSDEGDKYEGKYMD